MLINIWATLVHFGDSRFCGADRHASASLDLLICDGLRRATKGRQTWMTNPVWSTPGTTGQLLRDSYAAIRDSTESYLLLITPGFADLANDVPVELVGEQLAELCRRGRMFNKRSVTALLGTPPGSPEAIGRRISEWNRMVSDVTDAAGGVVADLRPIAYEPWSAAGSRPVNLADAAGPLVDAVIDSHASATEWRARDGA
ncbi:MAG: hypothetical protein ACXWBR_06770 [Usitatibacter sp.]